ncbi:hypothetical protein ACPVTF_03780 [Geobacillus icigianus]|uniref:hypothetical protein n=1 Tax=Geobacillus TaxID=129337 RepID=UPI000792E43F|nr:MULTISPECIES: hypothetical protein [Geobacillus]KYD28749.1 hypothetical protein B4113_3546 [Geobacillus sp. B4113_201601]
MKGDPDVTGLFDLRNEAGQQPVSFNHRPSKRPVKNGCHEQISGILLKKKVGLASLL